jgi:hypothetical protein
VLIQTNFKITWKRNSSAKPFEINYNNNQLGLNSHNNTPLIVNFSGINTNLKPTENNDSSVNLVQIEAIKAELANKKGFLDDFSKNGTTASELKPSQSKRDPVSQKMIQNFKGNFDNILSSDKNPAEDERMKWELKAQIARHVFKISKHFLDLLI